MYHKFAAFGTSTARGLPHINPGIKLDTFLVYLYVTYSRGIFRSSAEVEQDGTLLLRIVRFIDAIAGRVPYVQSPKFLLYSGGYYRSCTFLRLPRTFLRTCNRCKGFGARASALSLPSTSVTFASPFAAPEFCNLSKIRSIKNVRKKMKLITYCIENVYESSPREFCTISYAFQRIALHTNPTVGKQR